MGDGPADLARSTAEGVGGLHGNEKQSLLDDEHLVLDLHVSQSRS